MDDKWQPVEWFGSAAWLRAVLDAAYTEADRRVVIDYKTGKIRLENMDQLDLYALVVFAHEPTIKIVDAQLWYLDAGELRQRAYTREAMPQIRKTWVARTKKMLADTAFKPTPGNACRWCAFSKAKAGPCQF